MSQDAIMQRSLRLLEYNKILESLAGRTSSEGAGEMALSLHPEAYAEDAQRALNLTMEAMSLAGNRGVPSFRGLKNLSLALARAEMGGILTMRDLMDIKGVLSCARSVKDYFFADSPERQDTPLCLYFRLLQTNHYFEEKIERCILSEDEMADSASADLASIRRGIATANAKVREVLNRIISSPSYSKLLQDSIVTIRQGRYCVPVKSEHKADMPGLVHDISSSGQTIFIEPMSVVNLNNEIQTLQSREKKEIERILSELSSEAAGFAGAIEQNYKNLVILDFTFAKAQLAYDWDCYPPTIADEGEILLERARHPLIDPEKVVPIDIHLGKSFDTLVITGPNTGGKTVSLKTLGLLSLMAASGLCIPASENSRVRIFSKIYADIGDEQSIEQSLSTFSSHMTNITSILSSCDDRTLVIYDELGAGTDPVEGAALAISIIEESRRKGALVAATTHYAEIKVYAMKTPGVENASCEFDVATLRPTYRLLIGVPGRSNAFAIASRIGLEESVISHARELVAGENVRFEDLLDNLEERRQEMEREKAKATELRKESEELALASRAMEAELRAKREKLMAEAHAEAQRIIEETQRDSARLLAELSSLRSRAGVTAEEYNAAQASVGAEFNRMRKNGVKAPEPVKVKPLPRALRPGDSVEIVKSGIKATVISCDEKTKKVQLQAGILTITAKTTDLRLLEQSQPKQVSSPTRLEHSTPQADMSLDLRGMSADEAMIEVDNFLDGASRANLTEVTIIHGKGTGKLRDAVQNQLRHIKCVKSFRLGHYGEGESGVTIVELR